MPQLSAEDPNRIQANRVRPDVRAAAIPQLPAAMNAATASPMSSMSMVAWSLTHWNAVQAANTIETKAAAVAAAANGRQPSMPRPMTFRGRRSTAAG